MGTALETAGLVSLWLVAILRAPSAALHSRQRPLWLGVCLIAVTTTLYQEPVIEMLGHLVGDLNLIDLSRQVSHTLSAAMMLYFVLAAAARQRHARLLTAVTGVTIAATVWLNESAPWHSRSTISTPQLPLAYWLLGFGFFLVADGISLIVCWRFSRQAESQMFRWSLNIFGLSRLFACVLWVLFPL